MTIGGRREQNIRFIIEMEDRIAQCKRCKPLLSCVRKPAMGKGDLEPELVMVFESDHQVMSSPDKLLQLREMIKSELNLNKVYHTFLVRCQPKACTLRSSTACYLQNNKLIDRDLRCLLSAKPCEGIPIKPSDDYIISCLPFLLEELEILNPRIVLLFGQRVSEFVLKSYGIFKDFQPEEVFYNEQGRCFISLAEPEQFNLETCSRMVSGITISDYPNQETSTL